MTTPVDWGKLRDRWGGLHGCACGGGETCCGHDLADRLPYSLAADVRFDRLRRRRKPARLRGPRQAALLTDEGAALTYVTVSSERGKGASAVATLMHDHARACLRRASEEARELGVDPGTIDEHGDDPATRLMELAAGQDLLVVGIRGHSRAGGIMVGGAATAAVHRSPVPVLVVRT